MSEESQCPNCGQPLADESAACPHCGYRRGDGDEGPVQAESDAPDLDAHELRSLGGEGRHLHPLAPLIFILSGIAVGIGGALAAGPALGVALGLLGGGLGVWVVERGRRLR